MNTELTRFLHDQKRLQRGLPPAQWTPFKPELKQLNHLRPEVRRRIAAVQVTTTNPV